MVPGPQPHSCRVAERAASPAAWLELSSSWPRPPPGCSGPEGVLGGILPELWGCGGSCPGRNLTLPPGASPSPQPSNSGEKRRCTAPLEFISILILEPRFQRIIKLLYNYKQNVCAFSPVLSEWAQAGVERGEVQPAPQEWPAWRFPPVPVPGASESVRAACWGPA